MFKIKATAEELRLAKEFMSTVPVSFRYGDECFPATFDAKDGVYTSPDNAFRCEFPFQTYEDSAAVEWLPRFISTTSEKTKQIQNVFALDHVFPVDGETVLYYALGTHAGIDDFSLQTKPITADEPFVLTSNGSRSAIPFFNLKTGSCGIVFGLGFTGAWKATFTLVENGIHVQIGLNIETDFHLLPDEVFRHILVLAIFWKGDLQRSFNLLRNHLVRYYIPKNEEGEPCPPICVNTWGGMKTHNHLKYLKFIKENNLKFDCYWIDAGWHGPDHETDEFENTNYEDWFYNQGDWSVNRCVHPNGIKPISDAAHELGMKLLLWFGAYTCNEGIGWQAEHPEWQADNNTTRCRLGRLNTNTTIMHHINLDIPEARKWLSNKIADTLIENGCDWYREDTQIPPIPELPERMGIGAMKGAQYLYEFWDTLRERVPGLIIDNCGGGGTRIDLETLKRSYVLWRSDYNCHPGADPMGAQIGNYGLGHFIPLIDCAPPTNPGSTYTFLSGLYGSMSFGLFHVVGPEPEKHTWIADNYPIDWHKRMLEHYQLSKPYLSGNFYPLTPCTLERSDVLSYQFERPDLEGGIILAFFRPECKLDSFDIKPVIPAGKYLFTNPETGDSFEMEMNGDTPLTLTSSMKPEAIFLHYKMLH